MSDDLLSAMRSAYEAINRNPSPSLGYVFLSPYQKALFDVADKWSGSNHRRFKREINKFKKKWDRLNPSVVCCIDHNPNRLWRSFGVTGIVTTGAIE